jgi:hypothetical protein
MTSLKDTIIKPIKTYFYDVSSFIFINIHNETLAMDDRFFDFNQTTTGLSLGVLNWNHL